MHGQVSSTLIVAASAGLFAEVQAEAEYPAAIAFTDFYTQKPQPLDIRTQEKYPT